MTKFDPDFALFGTLAGDIIAGTPVEKTRVDYVNKSCISLYGDLRGKELCEVFTEIIGDMNQAQLMINRFVEQGQIAFEGKLAGKFVKFHSRILDCRNDNVCAITKYVQAGITDITEIVILKKLLYGTSEALRRAAEAADDDTGRHIARINAYSRRLATLSGANEKFVEDISCYAQLHDIGKIKIAEIIRLPRQLTQTEFEEVKRHVEYGCAMVAGLDGLEMAHDIILDHHERCDGSGYPAGKTKEEISIAGRIVAIVDVYDALVTARPYKKAFDYSVVRKTFENGDGRVKPTHFDPQLLRLFLDEFDSFVAIHQNMKD